MIRELGWIWPPWPHLCISAVASNFVWETNHIGGVLGTWMVPMTSLQSSFLSGPPVRSSFLKLVLLVSNCNLQINCKALVNFKLWEHLKQQWKQLQRTLPQLPIVLLFRGNITKYCQQRVLWKILSTGATKFGPTANLNDLNYCWSSCWNHLILSSHIGSYVVHVINACK